MMRAPAFWQKNTRSLWPVVLSPAARLFDAMAQARFKWVRPQRPPLPVICVGNFVAGGAGKTPTAIALAALLRELGRKPGYLSRGYGGSAKVPLVVDPARHDARLTGDEALLLARHAPVIVSKDRPAGARLASGADIDIIVMDDGLQNPSLAKSLSIAVIDADYGIGNGRVIPAGPLRASMRFQLTLVDAIVLIGNAVTPADVAALAGPHAVPILQARLVLTDMDALRARRVVAYAGIGRPEKFFKSLAEAGAVLAQTLAFADHHPFTSAEARRLLALASRESAQLVTTHKDFVRLAGTTGDCAALRSATRPVDVRLVFEDADAVRALLAARL